MNKFKKRNKIYQRVENNENSAFGSTPYFLHYKYNIKV